MSVRVSWGCLLALAIPCFAFGITSAITHSIAWGVTAGAAIIATIALVQLGLRWWSP